MGILKKIRNALTGDEPNKEDPIADWLTGGNGYQSRDTSEATYYTCLKTLSEGVGKLSLHLYDKDKKRIYDHEALLRLNGAVNPYMNGTTFKTLLEVWRNHYGNAYAYLNYDRDGKLLGIYPLDPLRVRVLVDNVGLFESGKLYYEYTTNGGETYYFSSSEMLHLKGGLSLDGLVGLSVRETLATTFAGVKASQDYLNSLYSSGMTAKSVLKFTGDLNEGLQKKMLAKIKNFTNFQTNSTNILPLPPGMDLVPLNLKLTDSQFFELKKLGSLQIAAAFGVKPNHLNDYSKSSYSNSESQNLSFYVETLLPVLTQYEAEINLKLLTEKERKKGLSFKFNVATILRGDMKTQAECITQYVTSGVLTINEARAKVGMTSLGKKGDIVVFNGSYVPLEQLGAAYEKGGGNNE